MRFNQQPILVNFDFCELILLVMVDGDAELSTHDRDQSAVMERDGLWQRVKLFLNPRPIGISELISRFHAGAFRHDQVDLAILGIEP